MEACLCRTKGAKRESVVVWRVQPHHTALSITLEQGQYFVTWTSEEKITPKQEQELPLLLKDMTHPLSGTVEVTHAARS